MSRNIGQGDLVQVVTKEGIKFQGIVVKYYPARDAIYFRVIFEDTTKYRPGCADVSLGKTNWSRYGIHEADGIFLQRSDCRSIELVHKATRKESYLPYADTRTNLPVRSTASTYTVADRIKDRIIIFTVVDTPSGEFGSFTQAKGKNGQVDMRTLSEATTASIELAQIYSILHTNGTAGKYEMR